MKNICACDNKIYNIKSFFYNISNKNNIYILIIISNIVKNLEYNDL